MRGKSSRKRLYGHKGFFATAVECIVIHGQAPLSRAGQLSHTFLLASNDGVDIFEGHAQTCLLVALFHGQKRFKLADVESGIAGLDAACRRTAMEVNTAMRGYAAMLLGFFKIACGDVHLYVHKKA